jgi:hypothetical protein
MNLKYLFSKKSTHAKSSADVRVSATLSKLDIDALDSCVGGRASAEGVGCYLQSEQSRVH